MTSNSTSQEPNENNPSIGIQSISATPKSKGLTPKFASLLTTIHDDERDDLDHDNMDNDEMDNHQDDSSTVFSAPTEGILSSNPSLTSEANHMEAGSMFRDDTMSSWIHTPTSITSDTTSSTNNNNNNNQPQQQMTMSNPSSKTSTFNDNLPQSPVSRKVQASNRSNKSPNKRKGAKDKKRKEEKKETIQLSLWIDGVAYEHGIMCTFCTTRMAIRHCRSCNDFYCGTCDTTNHAAKKRKDHIRSDISSLTLFDAASIITRAFRLNCHLKILQARCRLKYKRYFDKKSLSHYYLNTVYNTVSWKKPFCLRKQELLPFLQPDEAVSRIQGMYHAFKARIVTNTLLLRYYHKIFDRSTGKFYYAYNGPSKLIPPSSWKRPRYCGKLSYPSDIPIIYTPDVAALIIQRKWRAILVRESWRTIARLTFDQIWDPLRGQWNYYDPNKGILLDKPMKLMRSQPWDPYNIEEWNFARVALFLRRIGLQHLVKPFFSYGVIGKTLLLLDDEDYANMAVTNRIDIKKIEVEIHKIYSQAKKARPTEELIQRRERLRKAKLFDESATLIQKHYRTHLAKKMMILKKQTIAMNKKLEELQERTFQSGTWYTELPNIPSRLYKGDGILLQSEQQLISVTLPSIRRDASSSSSILKNGASESMMTTMSSSSSAIATKHQQDQHHISNPETEVKLPLLPVKHFGRKRDHLSTKGWGRRGPDNEWIDLSSFQSSTQSLTQQQQQSSKQKQSYNIMDSHPTRTFTEKLSLTGYDRRRYQKFCGVAVDAYEYSNLKDEQDKEPELLL